MKAINAETQIEDLMEDPKAYGMPTFEEFKRHRPYWMGRLKRKNALDVLDNGSQTLRNQMRKLICRVHGLPKRGSMPLEDVERILADHGYSVNDIDLQNRFSKLKKDIQMVDVGLGKYDVVVNFMP